MLSSYGGSYKIRKIGIETFKVIFRTMAAVSVLAKEGYATGTNELYDRYASLAYRPYPY